MPNTSFLCIDDQQDQSIDNLLELLSKTEPMLSFDRKTPLDIGEQIRQISDASKTNDRFGLLVDLRLDQEADANGAKVQYRGPTLAQELRTRMAEGEVRSFPIVLWSINDKFLKSYYGDDTSHDLFDAVYGKDAEVVNDPKIVCRQLISLAEGYRQITSAKQYGNLNYSILGLTEDDLGGVNSAFLGQFMNTVEKSATHEVSLHLLGDLVNPSGLLVEENIVAARLGVDQSSSGSDWPKLLEILKMTKYEGPFGDGWPRWWWFRIEDWWSGLQPRIVNLRRIGANERVDLLNKCFGLSLKPATPIAIGYSDKFFTVCFAIGKPLDPADGLRIVMPSMKVWHDVLFISTYAALNRIAKEGWQIDPLDHDRLDQLKKS